MLLKYFYDPALAHASYMVGCQKSGEAVVIDPGRDIRKYLEAAKAEGLRIVAAAETHIHADFVSGSRELASRAGATLYLSDEGPGDWKYGFANQHDSRLVKDGDTFYVGRVKLQVVHTPGHTPEHISFLLTDEGGGANQPMGIFTGDFVFVGSIGRPDLLEPAAGVVGSAESGARQLFRSMRKFRDLPDHLQVWPAHGAGSACGKGLGAIPSSTVGYEKLFNPALQYEDEQKFVDYILADQPETPFYFKEMKRVNKVGPDLLGRLLPVRELDPQHLDAIIAQSLVIDTAAAEDYAEGHVPGTINVPSSMLVQWAGFFVDYGQPLFLMTDRGSLDQDLSGLRSIGIDKIGGFFDTEAINRHTERYESKAPELLVEPIENGEVTLIDVRAQTEYEAGHIPGASHRFLGQLMRELDQVDRSKPVVTNCLGGGRSAIATSILQRAGFKVTNMRGGFKSWTKSSYPVQYGTQRQSA